MAVFTRPHPTALLSSDEAVEALTAARSHTLSLVAPLDDAQLARVHTPILSPLVWDLGHIAAYEDLWLAHRHGGHALLRPDLAAVYDAFETPRAVRGDVTILGPGDVRGYLREVRRHAVEAIDRLGVGDGFVHAMVARHELQHAETMLQSLCLARVPGYRPRVLADGRAVAGPAPASDGLDTVEVPGGEGELGAGEGGFAYDNERPRHPMALADFRIGRVPVTNATWLTFAEGGGYERREWWSDEGWAWKEEYDIERPGGWQLDLPEPDHASPPPAHAGREAPLLRGRPVYEWGLCGLEPLHPHKPVVHVSWFEADAFARAHDVRLPTEAEWERAATWGQEDRPSSAPAPSGPDAPNLVDSGRLGTSIVGRCGPAAPCGARDLIGNVWEWTSATFAGYPGFAAHPYREYSEVFFGDRYRVLRGGSWATSPRVVTATFRNWDLPQRRQIFAGVRIAKDG